MQRAGDRVRVTVQLIDAATDAHLWAENYDRELTAANIFAIQSEVATAIAAALRTSLTPTEQVRLAQIPTQDLEAWEAYQLGKQRMVPRTSAYLIEAERFFQTAIEHDPKFALAYVGLADALFLQTTYGWRAARGHSRAVGGGSRTGSGARSELRGGLDHYRRPCRPKVCILTAPSKCFAARSS